MDAHHVAHYAIAGALAASVAGLAAFGTPALHKGDFPSLNASEQSLLGARIAPLKIPELTVYCLGQKCEEPADDVVAAANAAGIPAKYEASVVAPDGVSVGASDPALARKLAEAIYEGSGHKFPPSISVDSSPVAYVSFGKMPK